MGEVWCATDTNLGRQVAIKILPDAFAQDPDRLDSSAKPRIPIDEALSIAKQIAEALEAAHVTHLPGRGVLASSLRASPLR
jgi:serine/threonine protein kinase